MAEAVSSPASTLSSLIGGWIYHLASVRIIHGFRIFCINPVYESSQAEWYQPSVHCNKSLLPEDYKRHILLKGGYRNFFYSFISPVGYNIWWENSQNRSIGPKNGPKLQNKSQYLGLKIRHFDRAYRAGRADKADRVDKADRTDRADRADKDDKADKADKADRADKADKTDRADMPTIADIDGKSEIMTHHHHRTNC